jgi:hypothetical protein
MIVLLAFLQTCILPAQLFAQAAGVPEAVAVSFTPAYLKGMRIDLNDPFKVNFIVHRSDEMLSPEQKQAEYLKLAKYFLASLAVPDAHQWVNLSPYEKDRILPDDFALTEMGRDLLAQDYLLKQVSASLINPDTQSGKKFWDEVYARAYEAFGTTDIPTDIFNKVWITPDKAVISEKDNMVYILESHLKVMMEKDYLAAQNNAQEGVSVDNDDMNISRRMMRELIIPAIEREVNTGKSFAPLRQVFSGMLLATWYKRSLKGSVLGRLYADQGKVKGVDQDPANNQQIYVQYVQAFRQGAFNLIKEDVDRYTQELIPRKYFSGGIQNGWEKVMAPADTASGRRDFSEEMSFLEEFAIKFVNALGGKKEIQKSLFNDVKLMFMNPGILNAYRLGRQIPDDRYQAVVERSFDLIDKKGGGRFLAMASDPQQVAKVRKGVQWRMRKAWLGSWFKGGRFTGIYPNRRLVIEAIKKELSRDKFGIDFDALRTGVFNHLLAQPSDEMGDMYVALDILDIISYVFIPDDVRLYRVVKPELAGKPNLFRRSDWGFGTSGIKTAKNYMLPGMKLISTTVAEARSVGVLTLDTVSVAANAVSLFHSMDVLYKDISPQNTLKGGIDLNAVNLDLQIKRDGKGILLPVSQQDLEDMHIEGLIPLMLDIKPATGATLFN